MTEIHEQGTVTVGDAETPKRQSKASEARYVATQKLIESHREEFEKIYEAEAKKRGATTKKMRNDERIAKLKMQLAALGVDTDTDTGDGDPDRTKDLGGNPVE